MTITRKYSIAVASLSVLAASIGPSVTPASAASAAPGDTILYVPGTDSSTASVTAYDLTKHSVAATFNTSSGASQAVVSPDGSTAYVALSDGHVTVINTSTNTVTGTIALTDSADAIALTPNGATAYVASSFGNSVQVINTATRTQIAKIPVGSSPEGIAISPDGSTAYVTNTGDNTVSVINTSTNTVTAVYAVGSFPHGIAVAPGGSDVYVTNSGDNTVSVLDFAAGTRSTVAVGKSPTSVVITPNGSTAYVANSSGDSVSVIDTARGTVTGTIGVTAADGPYGITISADGSTVYASCPGFHGQAAAAVIDTRTETVTTTITGLETASGIPAVAVTPGTAGGTGAAAVTRLGGTDRYATGRQVSQAQWRNGSANAVVLARGDAAPDALAGGPLAAHLHGPLLLTEPTTLDPATRAEIDRVLGGPASGKSIYILGGDNAISPAIQTELKKAGYNVVRLSGEDRFGTALAVAKQFGSTSEAIVATGLDFPDALAAGPLGAVRDAPIVLSNGTTLDPATASFLAAHRTIDAVGGAAGKAAARLGVAGRTVNVLAGGDRFATAEDVAAAVVRTTGRAPAAVGVAYAFNFPDALTGGAFAASAGEPLLLTGSTTADPGLLAALNGWRSSVTAVEIFGGKTVISQNTENQIANAVGGHES